MGQRKKRRKYRRPPKQQVGEIRKYRDVWHSGKSKKVCSYCFYPVNQYDFFIAGSIYKIDIDKKLKILGDGPYCSFECLQFAIDEVSMQPIDPIPEHFEQPLLDKYEKNN